MVAQPKSWNEPLIHNFFFSQPIALVIIQAPIIQDYGPDILLLDLTPIGKCNLKKCIQDLFAGSTGFTSQSNKTDFPINRKHPSSGMER